MGDHISNEWDRKESDVGTDSVYSVNRGRAGGKINFENCVLYDINQNGDI
jgi:hypothetical protein